MAANKISVIMRCKNSDWVIAQALDSLFSQTYKDFQLIVADSGSTDRTLEIVQQYSCQLIQIKPDDYYPGEVLNMAIEQAAGDIVVFQNSDAVPLTPYCLERLLAAFDDSEISAAFARQIPRPEAKSWVKREYGSSFPNSATPPPWITLSLPMAAIRKKVWHKHHFFTECWGSEDTEWGHWAKQNGLHVQYVKDAIVMHSHNYNLKQLYARKFIEGEADAFIYKNKYTLAKAAKQYLAAVGGDLWAGVKKGKVSEIWQTPLRRLVHFFAYYKAHRFGTARRVSGSSNRSRAQKEILSRYE